MNSNDEDHSLNLSSNSTDIFTQTDDEHESLYTEDEIFIKDKLIEWDLYEYIEIFKCQKIDKYVFLNMPNDVVEKLIPSIGHSQKFILKRKVLLSDKNTNEIANIRQPGQELRELLEETPMNFISSQLILNPAHQNELSYIIINHIFKKIKPSLKISKEIFIYWRTEIKNVWKQENVDFWYRPYIHKVQKIGGKLYHTYKNLKIKITKAHASQEDDNKEDQKSIDHDNLIILKLAELKKCTVLNDEALSLWSDTFSFRKQLKLSPTELFESYPLLKPPTGEKLIFQDFASTAGQINANALVEIWPELCLKIIFTAIKQKQKCLDIISKYKENFNSSNALTIAWRVFPFLFLPTSRTTKLKKKSVKISYQEQSDGFIRWINSAAEIESTIDNYNTRMIKYGVNIQPYIIAVGPPNQLIAAYCIIDGKKFLFKDVTSAVDFAWKTIIALDLEYSTISELIWIFIEKYIYNYCTSKKIYTAVENLSSLIQNSNVHEVSDILKLLKDASESSNSEGENNTDNNTCKDC